MSYKFNGQDDSICQPHLVNPVPPNNLFINNPNSIFPGEEKHRGIFAIVVVLYQKLIIRSSVMPLYPNIKRVQVVFESSVKTTFFNQRAYNDLRNHGHYLTDLNLIHCASIHFQSRFNTNIPRRFRATYDVIEPNMQDNRNGFYFDRIEDSEMQKQSSEVIATGFGISLFQKLFDVNFNNIRRIPPDGRRKRCDYAIILNNNTEVILECKGRKSNINKAKNEILDQKRAHPNRQPKYGCISHIPRNGDPSSIIVIDPPSNTAELTREQRIVNLLIYYTKALQLTGLYILANHLNKRINEMIKDPRKVTHYNNKEIVYQGNVFKLGRTIHLQFDNQILTAHISPNFDIGFKRVIQGKYLLFFGIDHNLLRIIEDQDYDMLLEYKYKGNQSTPWASIQNDGTFLAITPKDHI